jgi:hypothetical protein
MLGSYEKPFILNTRILDYGMNVWVLEYLTGREVFVSADWLLSFEDVDENDEQWESPLSTPNSVQRDVCEKRKDEDEAMKKWSNYIA